MYEKNINEYNNVINELKISNEKLNNDLTQNNLDKNLKSNENGKSITNTTNTIPTNFLIGIYGAKVGTVNLNNYTVKTNGLHNYNNSSSQIKIINYKKHNSLYNLNISNCVSDLMKWYCKSHIKSFENWNGTLLLSYNEDLFAFKSS